MDSARWKRIQTLFHEAAGQPETGQRAFLEAACGADETLVADVLALLEEDSRGATLPGHDIAGLASHIVGEAAGPFFVPAKIGPYQIRGLLGSGGMGTVYLAAREDLGSLAAIKTLRDAWMSPARRERFASEQRTLAQLNHPFIARLYDADTLPDGTPWFVMEYVEGSPLTNYCRDHACSIDERLRLFRAVCDAVQYAHQHAIIHRDLKPSNILIKADGSVRLLDFGIARHLDDIDIPVDQTRTELRLMTPAYAAPEQLRGDAVGVFTDIYALGVILYELLAGRLPFEMSNRTPGQIEQMIVEKEPEKPSAFALHSLGKTSWADLDVLCLTAMHKEPNRRYRSVEALIRDIDHYLKGEPLEARPDTLRYRVGKFVRRKRRPVLAATLVLTVIVTMAVFFTVRLANARDAALAAAARTERIQKFMLNLFEGGDRAAGPSESLRVVTLLDRGVQEAQSLQSEPEVQAELQHTLAGLYQRLGHLDRADQLFRSALDRRTSLFGPDHLEVAKSGISLGMLRVDQARLPEAEQLIREGLDRIRRTGDRGDVAAATGALGKVLGARGAYDQAVPVLEEAVKLLSVGPPTPELSEALSDLANTHYALGQYDASESLNLRVLSVDRQLFGERHPHVAIDLFNLGTIKIDRGRYVEAERYHRQGLEMVREWYGNDHPKTARSLVMLGQAIEYQGRIDDAAGLYEEALVIQERANGPRHPYVGLVVNNMAKLAVVRGNFEAAEALFRRAAEIFENAYGDRHEFYAHQLSNLAGVCIETKKYRRAEQLLREALERLNARLPEHRYTATAQIRLGSALAAQKRYREAEGPALAGYKILMKQGDGSMTELQKAGNLLGTIYKALDEPAKANQLQTELAARK
jgi:serine/threonine-protein kinase